MDTPSSPSFATAFGLFQHFMRNPVLVDSVSQDGLRILSSDEFWLANERSLIARTIGECLFFSVDRLGLPRFVIPAEYVAAAIAAYVKPQNQMVACLWSEYHGGVADELATGLDVEPLTATQLFAIVSNINSRNYDSVGPSTLQSRVSAALDAVTNPQELNPSDLESADVSSTS